MPLSPSGRARLRLAAVAILALLAAAPNALAQCPSVIRVPQDAPSINAAVAQVCANTAAEIVVGPGTWPAYVQPPAGSSVVVRGVGRESTIITPSGPNGRLTGISSVSVPGRIRFVDATLQGSGGGEEWRVSFTRCDVVACASIFFPEGATVEDTRFIDCQPLSWCTLYLQSDTQLLRCDFIDCLRPVLLWGDGGPLGHRLTDCTFRACTGNHVTIRTSCCAWGANRTRIERCTFDDLDGGSGSAIVFEANQAAGAQTPVLEVVDCTFRSLEVMAPGSTGGAIRIGTPGFNYPSAMSSTSISGSVFTGCRAGSGGAIFLSKHQPLTLANCTFTGNVATAGPGGAVAQEFGGWDQMFAATGCSFTGNTASGEGGALQLGGWSGTVTLSLCSFSFNSGSSGGAVHTNRRTVTIFGSQFIDNIATAEDGGAVFQFTGPIDIAESTFYGNRSARYGGALYLYSFADGVMEDCAFERNYGHVQGGAVAIERETTYSIDSCTFEENQSIGAAAVYTAFENTTVTVTNSTAFNNGPLTGTVSAAFVARGPAAIAVGSSSICGSGMPAWGAVAGGTATDAGGNCVVDACEDTDSNGVPDACQVVSVPADYPTIQAAINAVPQGSYRIIALAAGTHQGPVAFNGKRIALRGAGASSTFIQGTDGTDTSVVRASGEPAGARLEGVTIRGGLSGSTPPGSPSIRVGGGIFADQSALVVSGCVIESNASGFGGGAYFSRCTGALLDCTVRNNVASGDGGGLQIVGGSFGVQRTRVDGNVANGRGGGINVTGGGDTLLRRVDVVGNQSTNVVGGLSFVSLASFGPPAGTLLVQESTVESNSASVAQGGIGILDDTPATAQVTLASTRACGNSPSPNISGQWSDGAGNQLCDCRSDVNRDGKIDGIDLASLLAQWGPATASTTCDLNASGTVDGVDLATMLAEWGICGPASTLGLTSMSPASGAPSGGTPITVRGTGLLGVTSLRIGGVPCTAVTVVDSTTITAVTPAGTLGTRDLTVSTPSGTAALPNAYTYATRTVPAWATLIEPLAPADVVRSDAHRAAISATGFAWRVRHTATQIEMLLIPPGTFSMGCSASNQFGCSGNENPVRQVTLTSPLYLAKYEVTQAQWTAVMGTNPSLFLGQPDSPSRPVEQVSWSTIQSFLSQTGMRLPTEAEWEYAYRSGTQTAYHGFEVAGLGGYLQGTNVDSLLENIAWFSGNSSSATRPVGRKAANGLGLHDMAGNVWEFVADWYSPNYYSSGVSVDPPGPADGTERVFRGGSWLSSAGSCRSSWRGSYPPLWGTSSVGFRVARGLSDGPMLASVSPTSGPTTGGTAITLTGTNLTGTTSVTVGGAAATNVQVVNATTVTAVTPAGSAGARDVTVTTPGGTAIRTGGFTYFVPAPTLTAVTPMSGPVAGGTAITLTGTNLTGTTSVTVGGAAATSVQVVNATTVTAVTPAGTVGPRDVAVTTPGGTVTRTGGFNYVTVPTWATLVEAAPDPTVVTSEAQRTAIAATGLAWRVRDTATQIEMVLIPPGAFQMGCSPSNQYPCLPEENPVHSVTLTQPFYMGRYEVTQAQWTARAGTNPSAFQSASTQVPIAQVPNRPVELVSWHSAQWFASSMGMRLPTEAEWEYAYRAGTTTAFHSTQSYPTGADDDTQLGSIGWFDVSSASQTRPVGQLAGNGFGLHDMSGNVWEWVSDWYSETYYASSPSSNPMGPSSGSLRVLRGGAWNYVSGYCRSASRGYSDPSNVNASFGFRVVRSPVDAPTLTGVSPTSGPTTGGTTITLTGTNLTGATSVSVGGAAATNVQVVNATTVTAVTPEGTAGARDVSVTTAGGTATRTGGFRYVSVPSWAALLDAAPDPTVVTSATLRTAIEATGLAWRVRDTATQIELVLVPPGTYQRGCSPSNASGCNANENPVHQVTLTQPLYLGRYEVTQAQWTARMGSNPSAFQSASAQVPIAQVPSRPVENMSWTAIQGFLSAAGMRLPTEAEWEYAYRAGSTTAFHSMPGQLSGTNDDSLLGNIAWIGSNSVGQTRPVGQKSANGFGLHDMSGNVSEWVSDWIGTYPSSAVTNPTGPATGSARVYRGGGYLDSINCRASHRSSQSVTGTFVDVGFRVARNP